MRYSIIFLFLIACSPASRLNRLIKNHPELTKIDTITIKDSTFLKGSFMDSSFVFTGDTLKLDNGRQIINYYYNNTTHKNYISAKVKDTTLNKTIPVPVNKIIYQESKTDWIWIVGTIGGIAWTLLLLFLLIRKERPRY